MKVLDILFKDDIGLFVKHKILQSFSMNLISIFIPIYFYAIGFSLTEIFAWFFLFVFSGMLAFQYGGTRIANKIGAKNAVLLASFFYAIFMLLLLGVKIFPQMFFIAALAYSAWDSFYFVQREALFMRSAKEGHRGFTEGALSVMEQLSGMAAVPIGALVLVSSGMPSLIAFSIILFLFSAYPVYFMKNASFKAPSFVKMFRRKYFTLYAKMIARVFQRDCLLIFFPLYVFIHGFDIVSVGLMGSAMFAGSIIMGLLCGRLSDINDGIVMSFGAVGTFIFWLVLAFFKSNITIFSASFALNLFLMSLYLSVFTKATNIGARTNPSGFAFSMMFIENIGSALLFLSAIAVLILAMDLRIIFLLSSLSSIAFFVKGRR